jgi:predicted ATP-grasp superfamily ATP-dependent carboligase
MGAGMNLIEVVRSLALAGVHSVIVPPSRDAARLSRHATRVVSWEWTDPAAAGHDHRLIEQLIEYGQRQQSPAPLLFTSDEALLFVSRHEKELAKVFRIAIAATDSIEAMVDKGRFATLAESLSLRVPRTLVIEQLPERLPDEVTRLGFPLIVKPYRRDRLWHELVEPAKATLASDVDELRVLWPRLVSLAAPILLQECIPGPESRIESYHVYVDQQGRIAGEFAGRKIRTLPRAYGNTTSLTITHAGDVLDRGRELVRVLDLRGVAKVDFKRSPDGELVLLEINPRFHLWHHPGARSGVNIPALVYADLTNGSCPTTMPPRSGVRWVHPYDVFSARTDNLSPWRWLAWASQCEAKAFWAWDDPLPLIAAVLTRMPTRR